MAEPDAIDLTDVPDDALYWELVRRHKAVLVAVLHREATGDEITEQPCFSFGGGRYQAIGLAQAFVHRASAESLPCDLRLDDDEG